MNSCFEGLEGRMGLNRVREFIPKAGKKRGMKVRRWAVIRDFGSFTGRGLLADLERPVEIYGDISQTEQGGETGEEMVEDRKTTNLPVMRE